MRKHLNYLVNTLCSASCTSRCGISLTCTGGRYRIVCLVVMRYRGCVICVEYVSADAADVYCVSLDRAGGRYCLGSHVAMICGSYVIRIIAVSAGRTRVGGVTARLTRGSNYCLLKGVIKRGYVLGVIVTASRTGVYRVTIVCASGLYRLTRYVVMRDRKRVVIVIPGAARCTGKACEAVILTRGSKYLALVGMSGRFYDIPCVNVAASRTDVLGVTVVDTVGLYHSVDNVVVSGCFDHVIYKRVAAIYTVVRRVALCGTRGRYCLCLEGVLLIKGESAIDTGCVVQVLIV